MRRIELELEHRYKNRFVGRRILKEGTGLVVLGSSREADIRLLGDDVNGIHAIIDCSNGVWSIADAGSERGTWVKKKPIVYQNIQGSTLARIGGHDIKITPRVIESEIFKTTEVAEKQTGDRVYHQVVVRRFGYIVQSELVPAGKPFVFSHGQEAKTLECPKNSAWVIHEFGNTTVQQRLIRSDEIQVAMHDRMQSLLDPNLRAPFLTAFLFLLIFAGLIALAPSQEAAEMAELKPQENKFTKIIYDASATRKKRVQAKQQSEVISKKQRQTASAPSHQKPSASKKSTPVVSQIKTAGLSKMLSRISSRASNVSTKIRLNVGGSAPARRSPASVGSVKGVPSGVAGASKTFKVGNVKTAGKGGGGSAGNYKAAGGLAIGNVGRSTVGILEEETEIQGGLDREVIARVINSQLGEIRYCYERQLSANPDIYGKVLVKFTIGPAGQVVTQQVGLSTLRSAMVEGCILRRVAGWQFPKPKGGTSVLVTYPFLFKSTN